MSTSKPRSLIFSRPAVILTVVVAFALLLTAVSLSTLSTREVSAADQRAAHSQRSLALVSQLLATINEAETAQRGYILTNDPKYLAPYEAARPRYRTELAALERQYASDPLRSALFKQLSSLCDQRFTEIARTVRLRREHGIAPALNVVESDEGWRLMNEIRQRLRILQQQDLAAISMHTAEAREDARLFQLLNIALLTISTLLTAAVAWAVIRRLSHLEGLIKVCAWTKRVQWEGQWISFEEYLAKRFNLHCTHGISEDAAEKLGREIERTPVNE